jgi:hypothetical protein
MYKGCLKWVYRWKGSLETEIFCFSRGEVGEEGLPTSIASYLDRQLAINIFLWMQVLTYLRRSFKLTISWSYHIITLSFCLSFSFFISFPSLFSLFKCFLRRILRSSMLSTEGTFHVITFQDVDWRMHYIPSPVRNLRQHVTMQMCCLSSKAYSYWHI